MSAGDERKSTLHKVTLMVQGKHRLHSTAALSAIESLITLSMFMPGRGLHLKLTLLSR